MPIPSGHYVIITFEHKTHFKFHDMGYAIRLPRTSMCSKKRCRDGVTCVVFYNLSCLYTAIPTPSFCGFWHCGIPTSFNIFGNVFITCLCTFLLYNTTLKEDVVLASFLHTNQRVAIRCYLSGREIRRLGLGRG